MLQFRTFCALSIALLALSMQAVFGNDVVRRIEKEVSAEIHAVSFPEAPHWAGSVSFDPITRGRNHLQEWTTVPDAESFRRRSTPDFGSVSAGADLPGTVRGEMAREYYATLNATIGFPPDAPTADAIRRIASGRVSSVAHYCARTMREALGWGLGDAHEWMALPDRGYTPRPKDAVRPGDIVVWPFTYGRNNSQHIGIAVDTNRGLRLLSNLEGTIRLTRILGGYQAFWKG